MNLESFSIVKYLLDQQYVVTQDSNIVTIKLINPIVFFKEVICDCCVKVKIFNNSGITLSNLIYYSNTKFYDVKINHKKYPNGSNKLKLGDLEFGNMIVIEYRQDNSLRPCSLLNYNLLINEIWNTMYITSKY